MKKIIFIFMLGLFICGLNSDYKEDPISRILSTKHGKKLFFILDMTIIGYLLYLKRKNNEKITKKKNNKN
jgi:hypothetical protein